MEHNNLKYSIHFTLEERKIIQEHYNLARSMLFIAKLVNKSDKAVKNEIIRNSIEGKYIAEEAQKLAMKRKMLHLEKAHASISKQNRLKERIDALEDLVKALSEIVEEFIQKS